MSLKSYLAGRWHDGAGEAVRLYDPVNGEVLAEARGGGLDLAAALDHARAVGGPALRAMSFAERGAVINAIAKVLIANKERYQDIALCNCGATVGDAAFDIDGGIGTLKYYAGLARGLGDAKYLVEAGDERLTRDENFTAAHVWTPIHGAAVHINAFNFPSWGLWEKAAVSLFAGVPFLAKPATATAWLAYEMVRDVIAAGVAPEGSISILCGGGRDLMDTLLPGDVVAFTGSAETARFLRSNPNVIASGVRFGVEADSLNFCCLAPGVTADAPEFDSAVREVVREMTVKAGQKCTAIRRVLVPRALSEAFAAALEAALAEVKLGDPRDENVRMGPVTSKTQQAAVLDAIATLSAEARVIMGGGAVKPEGVDPDKGCFVAPTVLVCDQPMTGDVVHRVEAFGPVVTLMPYDDAEQAKALALMGGGSLAGSLFGGDPAFQADFAVAVASAHGRLLLVDASIAKGHSGHGVVMPQCVHGGPGRAGGGEELGGLRGARFYSQRTAVQGTAAMVEALRAGGATAAL